MTPEEEKKITNGILNSRRLPYSIELLEVQGDKYTVKNTFDSQLVYIRKGDQFFLDEQSE